MTAHAYHGVTTATTALSPEEWRGGWRPDHVESFAPPADAASSTDAPVRAAIGRLADRGYAPAALIVDTSYTSDGVLVAPDGYHAALAAAAREAGALVVADEVQAGYGRTGEHLWSFAAVGLEPDLVTLGKPMGNGHPVAAVIARRADVDRLAARTEFFSTFGGNPVAAAAGLAVLDVIRDEELIARAAAVGARLLAGLEALASRHAAIAAVRGRGLLLGVELVDPGASTEPGRAADLARARARRRARPRRADRLHGPARRRAEDPAAPRRGSRRR